MKIRILLLVTFLMFYTNSQAQITQKRNPRSKDFVATISNTINRQIVELPAQSKTSMPQNDIKTPSPFAVIVPINIDFLSTATVDTIETGILYRTEFQADGAYSLGFWLDSLQLQNGVEMYFYGSDSLNFVGAVTQNNNNNTKSLRIAQVPGNQCTVEMYVPFGINQQSFIISKVYYDFINIFDNVFKISKDSKSSVCSSEVDINCDEGVDYQDVKRSVVSYSYDKDYYSYLCSGVLMNSTRFSEGPFLLTAAHCVCDNEEAATALFYFNYERKQCGLNENAESQTLERATVVATSPRRSQTTIFGSHSSEKFPTHDFTLLKLSTFPPVSYKPFYAGFNISTTESMAPVACIHHPNGAVKKISLSTGEPYQDDYPSDDTEQNYYPMCHWHVSKWKFGTTEGGSSGAPLFNSRKQVIGTLSGGYASCSDPSDDFFQMISQAWTPYSNAKNQLKNWIAPNTNLTSLPSYDPYSISDNLPVAILNGELNENQNSVHLSWLTENYPIFYLDFNNVTSITNLDFYLYNNLKISSDDNPEMGDCLMSSSKLNANENNYFVLPKISLGENMVLSFYARTNGKSNLKILQNTSPYRFKELSVVEVGEEWTKYEVSLSAFDNSSIYLKFIHISVDEASTLYIDNISVQNNQQSETVKAPNGYKLYCNNELVRTINDGSITSCDFDIEYSHSYSFCISNLYGDIEESGMSNVITFAPGFVNNDDYTTATELLMPETQRFEIFPNPTDGKLFVSLKNSSTSLHIFLVDMTGKIVKTLDIGDTHGKQQIEISVEDLAPNVYLLHITSENKDLGTEKFILR